jgi:Kef-type K+ transport system membrane component KefB
MEEAVVRLEWQLILLAIIIIIAPYLAERARLPGLIGLVLGGLLIGPYGLHLLAEGSLDAIGGIGLLFLMFIAGAELDLNLFERYRRAAISFGLLTFLFPFVFGAIAAYFLGLNVAAAILMGSVWASHTLVAYPTVRESGLATNKAVAVTVSATVITDTLALLILAIISSTQSESSSDPLSTIVRLLIGLGALVVWCMVILPRLARWFYAGLGQERILRFVFVVGALASAGFLASLVGIEGIVGAFFAGLGLNRLIPNNGRLMESIEFFASSLFIPAFLVMVGMLIDPSVLFNPQTILFAAVFLAALAGGKFLAAWLGGKRSGFERAEIMLMFSLTIAQAAATLAATIVGFEIGLFTDQIVNSVLLVVMFSLILSSIGAARASKQIKPEALVRKPVGKHVLVPVGLNNDLKSLMPLAAQLAYADAGVVNPLVIVPENETATLRPTAEKLLAQAEGEAKAAMAEVEGELRVDASVPQGIVRALHEADATLVLIEIPERVTLSSYLFGTVIDQIGARTPVPAAAVHFARAPLKRIVLVPGTVRGDTGYRVDLQIAADLSTRLANVLEVPLRLLSTDGKIPEGITLPDKTEISTVAGNARAVRDALDSGDMVVIPCATLRNALQNRLRTRIQGLDEISLIVAAGPYRLRLTGAPVVAQDTERIINLNTVTT